MRHEKERIAVSRRTQDVLPAREAFRDGMFRSGRDLYTKTYRFSDINYAVASANDKREMFLGYERLLNALDSGIGTQITLYNRVTDRDTLLKGTVLREREDGLDGYREEYNGMLREKAQGAQRVMQEKYITLAARCQNEEDAKRYLARKSADLGAHLAQMGSRLSALDLEERLRLLHDFYRTGEEKEFSFDADTVMRLGQDFRDAAAPETLSFEKDMFRMGDRFGRVLYLRDYAAYIRDSMLQELTDLERSLMLSVHILPVDTQQAVREAEMRLLGVETNITNWQRRQNTGRNWSATVPYDMARQKEEMKEFLDDLTKRDQRMLLAQVILVHTADTKEQLDEDTRALMRTAQKHLCRLCVLSWRQEQGLCGAMPFGVRRIEALRTLTTESLAVLMPFRVQDVVHEEGMYYGQNVISGNMILADRRQLLNGNAFILGVSGSGKSFAAKSEIVSAMLSRDCDVLVIDPEREYDALTRALGGSVIRLSAAGGNHINAMDIHADYADGVNPVILKSEFIISLCEQLIGERQLGAREKSVIDRCAALVYRDYQKRGYTGEAPTLRDFRMELLRQEEPEAQEIALAIELFTHGSLNTFAQQTSVDTDNRMITYDILDLGPQLRTLGMLVVLDAILNRITKNRREGRQTFLFIDEIYLLFQHEYTANFLFTLWKRVRKYGAFATGITQNVDDLLQSHTARTMLANSEFIIMLNQAPTDRAQLASLLSISPQQLSYITNAEAGRGLIRIGSALIPFEDRFPKDTALYRLMTTKPQETGKENTEVGKDQGEDGEDRA